MVVVIMISSFASAILCITLPLMLNLPGFSTKAFSILLDVVELGNCIGFFVHYIIAMKYLKSTVGIFTSKYNSLLHKIDISIISGFIFWHLAAQIRLIVNLNSEYYQI